MLNKILGKLRRNLKNKKGFTLIELIVVIAIIAILIALIAPNVLKFVGDADKTAKLANAKSLYIAASTFQADVYANGGSGFLIDSKTNTAENIAQSGLKDYLDSKTVKTLDDKGTSANYKITFNSDHSVEKAIWDGVTYGNGTSTP